LPYQSSTQTYGPIATLFSFNGADGANLGALAFYNGNLFGTANTGGASGQGTVFELDLGSDTLTTLVTFNGTNGANPALLITDSIGNLYGTVGGGAFNAGMVFKLPYNNLTHMYGPLSTLATFDGTNGAAPGGARPSSWTPAVICTAPLALGTSAMARFSSCLTTTLHRCTAR
jgi:uncharacterized repeat protein (TIGR03803 family)